MDSEIYISSKKCLGGTDGGPVAGEVLYQNKT